MTLFTLVRRSLRFHARSHVGAILGAAIASAVLLGALLVGDSVRESLKEIGLARLAGAQAAIASGDRFFRDDLWKRVRANLPLETRAGVENTTGTAALILEGIASSQAGATRANGVQVLGITGDFAGSTTIAAPATGEVWLSESLAQQLKVKLGDDIVLRVRKPSALSRDTIITPRSDSSFALRLKVSRLAPESVASFRMAASQLPAMNAFVALPALQKAAGLEGRANLLLSRGDPGDLPRLETAMNAAWIPADAELELRTNTPARLELGSRRIFLDPQVVSALRSLGSTNSFRVLTYLVNQLRHGNRMAPYSMVTATDGPQVPADLRDDEVVINEWLAADLGLRSGDTLEMAYYVLDSVRSLTERTNTFRVRAVVPIQGWHDDRTLMPEFPGLTKAESTREWDAGFELFHEIRNQDEAYWKRYRGTPKAFLNLAAGQKLWGNRFGELTAVRFQGNQGELGLEALKAELGKVIKLGVTPAQVGLRWEPVRAEALKAATSGQDFGQLFIGFSLFLVVAALLLMSLLFQFSIERRTEEVGTLLALGFTPKRVRRLLLLEGGGLALAGSLVGLAGAVVYARLMLHGLSTIWREAVGTSLLSFHAAPSTLAGGLIGGWVVAWLTMAWALRRQARQSARVLLAGGDELDASAPSGSSPKPNDCPTDESENSLSPSDRERVGVRGSFNCLLTAQRRRLALALGAGTLAVALAIAGLGRQDAAAAGLFFGAGALLLIGGLSFASYLLTVLEGRTRAEGGREPVLTLIGLGFRNATRRRRRSLGVIALLACGSFLVTSLGVFRLDAVRDAGKRPSGTGGFALVGESTLPITQDLNTQRGRDFFGIEERGLDGVGIVPFRVRDGDDASCLNLNRAQRPRLLGVDPEHLASRGAFTFTKAAPGGRLAEGWRLLRTAGGDTNVVAAIGDANSIQWALGRKLGDSIDYVDEAGRPFQVLLVGAVANSILQGNLLIDEAEFTRRFPSASGHRMLLLDVPSERVSMVSDLLTRSLSDYGLEVTLASRRLAAFNAVQNTYLGTFQILGGLGLLLGSFGLGVVVLRHVLERRGELALLLAVGFRRPALSRLVLSEHAALLAGGLGLGMAAALLAVLPAAMAPGAERPGLSLALTLIAVLLNGALWTWMATRAALRGPLLHALRNE